MGYCCIFWANLTPFSLQALFHSAHPPADAHVSRYIFGEHYTGKHPHTAVIAACLHILFHCSPDTAETLGGAGWHNTRRHREDNFYAPCAELKPYEIKYPKQFLARPVTEAWTEGGDMEDGAPQARL
jgi:hypothetical protein